MDIDRIRSRIRAGRYTVSFTHTEKLRERMIEAVDVEEAVFSGNLEEEELLIVTAYEPDPEEWEKDWKTRKRGS